MRKKIFKASIVSLLILFFLIGCGTSETRGRLFSYMEDGDFPILQFVQKKDEWLGVFHISPPQDVKSIKIKAKYIKQHQWKTKELADIEINPEVNQGAIDLMVSYESKSGDVDIHYSSDYATETPAYIKENLNIVGDAPKEYQPIEGDVWLDTQKEYILMGNGVESEEIYNISQEFDSMVVEKEEGVLYFVIECEV